ncbi:MAG: c-type cytochrome [Pseudomonadota bacterium]
MRAAMLGLSVAFGLGGEAGAQEPGVRGGDAEEGGRLFALYCATCHGAAADGAGRSAGILSGAPADLTGLSARNGGRFPVAETVARIDGRAGLEAHGGAMPVYGRFFSGAPVEIDDPRGAAVSAAAEIADIVAWLETQQRE